MIEEKRDRQFELMQLAVKAPKTQALRSVFGKPNLCKRAQRVAVRLPAPRQKNSAPFRFRGLRKSRENCTSAESFFLYQIEPASLGFDLDTGSNIGLSGLP